MGTEAGPTIVWLQGEHDIASDRALRRTLAGAIALNDAALVLDLSQVALVSASTLGIVVTTRNFLRQRSRSLTLRSPSRFVRHILRVCDLDYLLGPSPAAGDDSAVQALGFWVAAPKADRTDRTDRTDRQPGGATTAPSRIPEHAGLAADR